MPKLRIPFISDLSRPAVIGLTAFATTLLALVLLFAADRLTNGGEILGAVNAGGIDLGGLGEEDARARLDDLEESLRATPIEVHAAGHSFFLNPSDIEFDLDTAAMVDAALGHGRNGNVLAQLGWWVGQIGGGPSTVEPVYSFDREQLAALVENWEVEGIGQAPFPGDIRVEGGAIVYEYPATGVGIEREAAMAALETAMLDPRRSPVTLETRLIDPDVTSGEIDEAVATATSLIAADVTLTEPEMDVDLVLPRHLLARSLVITREGGTGPIPGFLFDFDDAAITGYVAALGPYLETEGVDAQIVIDEATGTVSIIPSVPVTAPDPLALVDHLWEALGSPERRGPLTYAVSREADFSTADAEAMGIQGVIGEFTTHHPCCAARVTNIHLIADAVDGAIVMPGETWSLNDHVGQRTTAKGYVCAGALQGNELVEEGEICIGGGTSQFTTTLYNAIFFAGLEDVDHTPHSVWFSRYPEGREATLGWRHPALIFRNNTASAVIIKTSYTGTSVTAQIYGNNGGLVVEAGLSNRYNHTGIVTRLRQNDELAAPYCSEETAKTVQQGSPGWSVTVYRYITYPDGTKTTEQWGHRYYGMWEIKEWDADDPTCLAPPTTTTTTTMAP